MMANSFYFYSGWVKFGDTIQDNAERLNYYRAITKYGLQGDEPKTLHGATLRYFNTEIRPQLDKQHRALTNKSSEI